MIYTVTLNAALDKTVVIPGFHSGQVNRIRSIRKDPGGKGINVSKAVQKMGGSTTAMGLLAGAAGDEIECLLQGAVEQKLFLRLNGETRTNMKITDPVSGEVTDINEPGPQADEMILSQLKDTLLRKITEGDIVVLSGSLPIGAPASLYREWILACKEKGVRVILDADGEALKEGLKAAPWLVKPNDAELERLTGHACESIESVCEAVKELRNKGIENVVVSLGAKGAIFGIRDSIILAEGLSVPVVSTVGAGDTMVAALAYAAECSWSAEETVVFAIAASAAKVMQSGSQPPQMDQVESLKKLVKFRFV